MGAATRTGRAGRTRVGSWASGRRRLAILATGAATLAGVGYVAVTDPHDPDVLLPTCPIKAVTGLDCPACGGLRLVHDLAHGHLAAAAGDNLYLLIVSPVLLYLLTRQARAFDRGERAPVPRPLAFGLAGGALAWMVLRNLPGRPA